MLKKYYDTDTVLKAKNLISSLELKFVSMEEVKLSTIDDLYEKLSEIVKINSESCNKLEVEEVLKHISAIRNILTLQEKFKKYNYQLNV